MQHIGLAYGADFHLLADPPRTAADDFLLLQPVDQFLAFVLDLERFLVGSFRIEGGNETGLAKEEVQLADTIELGRQRFIGVEGKVGGYHG